MLGRMLRENADQGDSGLDHCLVIEWDRRGVRSPPNGRGREACSILIHFRMAASRPPGIRALARHNHAANACFNVKAARAVHALPVGVTTPLGDPALTRLPQNRMTNTH